MSGTSEVSRVSTILGGVRDDGMDVICIAQREPSVTFKEFVKTYNPKKMQEFLDEQEADDERRRALRMAWILIEEVQRMYSTFSTKTPKLEETISYTNHLIVKIL